MACDFDSLDSAQSKCNGDPFLELIGNTLYNCIPLAIWCIHSINNFFC